MKSSWRFYIPDDGDTADNAEALGGAVLDAEDAAYLAARYDYDECDGWHFRKDNVFEIVVIAPDGEESHWVAWHEATINHIVEPAETT